MEKNTKVGVFESDNPAEIQLMKSKLTEMGIENFVENKYMTFTTTPTATSLMIKVRLVDEKRAFEIIDEYLRAKDS